MRCGSIRSAISHKSKLHWFLEWSSIQAHDWTVFILINSAIRFFTSDKSLPSPHTFPSGLRIWKLGCRVLVAFTLESESVFASGKPKRRPVCGAPLRLSRTWMNSLCRGKFCDSHIRRVMMSIPTAIFNSLRRKVEHWACAKRVPRVTSLHSRLLQCWIRCSRHGHFPSTEFSIPFQHVRSEACGSRDARRASGVFFVRVSGRWLQTNNCSK